LLYISGREEYKTVRYTACCGIPEGNGKLMDFVVANSIGNSEF